ncbi:MAG TPA: M56 family metallopeptidase, partial [Gemmatimonadaceae bacterium]|nr:M56 family metallopeptidase [Gemmatimonadaceae bacterium]
YAVRASVLLGAALLASWMLRRASAATRHLVFTAVMTGVLLLPGAMVTVPRWNVPVLAPDVATSALPSQVPAAATASLPSELPAARRSLARPIVDRAGDAAVSAPTLRDGIDAALALLNMRVMLALFWCALTGILLLRLAIANARLASWERGASVVEDARTLGLLRRLCRQYGIRRPVTLLESGHTDIPVTWGVVYPVVLIPDAWWTWDEEQRVAVLTHELAHVKRFDALTQQLAQAAVALLWFNPLIWVVLRRMRLEREHACDDFVLAGGARATRYADDLLGLARRLARPTAPAAAALAMARRSELEGRLLAILDPRARRGAVARARVALTLTAVLVLSLPLAAFSPARGERSPSSATLDVREARQKASPAAAPLPRLAPWVPSASVAAVARTAPAAPVAGSSMPAALSDMLPRLAQTPTLARLMIALPDTDPARSIDLETLIEVTKAAKRMTSDSEKGQILALIAKRYQRNTELRDSYLEAVMTMSSDDERSKALLALLERDSLPRGSVAQVLQATAAMSSDVSKGEVLQRISPAIYADTAVQRAYLDAIVGMSSDTQRGAALSSLLKQSALTAQMQLALLDAIVPMSSDTEKANALTLFLERQGLGDQRVRRAFFSAAETLTSDADYRRVMTAVMK